jgi:hypothetical protein
MVEASGGRSSRGEMLEEGGHRYSGTWAAPGECGPARGEGKWAKHSETVPGGGGKLIQI